VRRRSCSLIPVPEPSRAWVPWFASGLGLVSFVFLLGTAGDYGLTWDEPTYIESADRLQTWFSELGHGTVRESLRPERIRDAWVFARRDNRNLPVPVLLSMVGHICAGGLSPPASYRVGSCALMAGTLACLFWTFSRRKGLAPGLVAAGALLLDPPVFGHAHIAATDTPVSCLLVLSLLLWLESRANPRLRVALVIVCGLGFASKASFGLFPVVLLAWLLLFGDRKAWVDAGWLALWTPAVTLLFCPMWWEHPLDGPLAFLTRLAHAGERWQVDAYYLGRASVETLPWHSGFVLAALTTPPLTLLAASAGAIHGVRRRDGEATLWLLGALSLPVARMLPNAPAHDAARLLLPSLYCLAPLAGLGFYGLQATVRHRAFAPLLLVAILGMPARAIASMHPYEMSYYSECVGGLPGAERLGFEVTYWFDALTPEARDALQALLPVGARVQTAPRYTGYPLLRQWGLWRRDIQDDDDHPQYLILYGRKGYFAQVPALAQIVSTEKPLWVLRFRGVPLILLYARGQASRVD
jgi:hypothetical protein